jgi:hypothetical protein
MTSKKMILVLEMIIIGGIMINSISGEIISILL